MMIILLQSLTNSLHTAQQWRHHLLGHLSPRGHIFVMWPHPQFLQIVKRLVGQIQEVLDGFAVEQTRWELQMVDTVCGELLSAGTRTC